MRFPELPGYQYEDLLSEDPFGWTFVASHESGKRRVIRVFKAQATNDRFLNRYFRAFSDPQFSVQGIARIYDYVLQDHRSLAACALPFYGWRGKGDQGWQVSSLDRLIDQITPEQSTEVIRELALCLEQLHRANLFHGGLRQTGIFLTVNSKGGQTVRLTDLGQIFMGGLQFLEAGDLLYYASPEQLETGDFANGRGKSWDVYAFGVIAFQILTGKLPRLDMLRRQCAEHPEWMESAPAIAFGELTDVSEYFLTQLENEKDIEWPETIKDPLEKALRPIISACLSFDPDVRCASMEEVARLIEDACRPVPEVVPAAVPVPVAREMPEKMSILPVIEMVKAPPTPAPDALEVVEEETVYDELEPAEKISIWNFKVNYRENPVVFWQAVAVLAMIAILPLTWFSFVGFFKMRDAKNRVAMEAAELQAELQSNVDKQASAYRKAISEQEKNEQLKSELNEAEDSKSRLIGEAKLARQIVRQTQENGDRFFRLVMENRDTDVADFREGRAQALIDGRKHYERLVEAYGDAPDFIVSTANALFYLGQIYKEMGEFGKALAAFGEAERRYSALMEDESTTSTEFVKNIALSKSALGQLSIKSGQYSVARHYFTESSRFWAEVRSQAPDEAVAAGINIHENSLDIVECEFAMDRPDAALDGAISIGVQLSDLQEKSPDDDRIIGALAKSFSLTGRVLESKGDNELAKEAYQQASDLFARAVGLDAAVDSHQLGLGNSLARVGLLTNDFEKLEASAEILGKVVAANPYESTYLKTLADTYGVLSRNQRDGGKLENAVDLDKRAIAILQPILDGNQAVTSDVRYSYSQRLAHLAELLGDSGKFDESRAPLGEAIRTLETLVASETSIPEYQRALARARGMVGFACIKTGDKSEAKEHLELAKTEWESFVDSNPEDVDAVLAVQWTSDQLKTLR